MTGSIYPISFQTAAVKLDGFNANGGDIQMSIIGLIFIAVTLVCGVAYWYVDKKMVFAIESLKDLYKLCLIIIYATQLILIFIFLF
jgi:hypothetical protein